MECWSSHLANRFDFLESDSGVLSLRLSLGAQKRLTGGAAKREINSDPMALRIAFDLDGVLADMESELVRQAGILFGDAITRRAEEPAQESATETVPVAEASTTTEEKQAAAETAPENVPPLLKLK